MEGKKLPIVIKILESPVALALGSFSYSLYLTHALVITLMRHFLLNFQLSPNIFVVLLYLMNGGAALLFAYLFYLVFEKPFLSKSRKKFKVVA